MKSLAIIATVAAGLSLAGCASPLVKPAPLSFQPKVAYAANIQQLANSVALNFGLTVKTTDRPLVYVAPGPADMPFASTFRSDLEQALMAQGFSISRNALGAEVLNFEVQPFLYGSDHQKHLVDYNSFWTTWANIGYQISQANHSAGTGFAIAGVVGSVLDVLDAMDQSTPAEVVLKLSVVDVNRVFYVQSKSFYVHPADLPFYMTSMPGTAPQNMVADVRGLPVVSLRVSGF